ncbi:MAG: Holliday junction branch migration protein RuvA [Lachnospiraceae bacterium]|nr:Holliday junction branch migration protein RuvA [Lachnospiraceae bacterium]
MIAYLKGKLADIAEENVVLEVNNIGYNVKITGRTLGMLPPVGEEIKIYTYTYVREDAIHLYGFLTRDDLSMFKLLITVNGIGPKGALAVLSVMDADELRFAIISGDAKAISKAPGIGGKTAERAILDLKDKVSIEDSFVNKESERYQEGMGDAGEAGGAVIKEAAEALTALGYSASEALRAVKQVENAGDMSVEEVLKLALKKLF